MKRRFKTILSMVLVLIMLSSTAAFANPNGEIEVFVDGYQLYFDTQPYIENGTTMVPLRNVLEAFGNQVDFVPKTNEIPYDIVKVTLTRETERSQTLILINENYAVKFYYDPMMDWGDNDDEELGTEEFMLNAPAKIVNGKTMVPLRFIAEISGYVVKWDAKNKVVNINSDDYYNGLGGDEYNNAYPPISEEQKAINDKYVQLLETPVDSYPGAFQ